MKAFIGRLMYGGARVLWTLSGAGLLKGGWTVLLEDAEYISLPSIAMRTGVS